MSKSKNKAPVFNAYLFGLMFLALLTACSGAGAQQFSESELATALAAESANRTQEAASQPSPTMTGTVAEQISATATASPIEIGVTEPHGDGIYLVGSEMATGRWRSVPEDEGHFCYWARRKYDGVVLGSYYGLPGGELLIRQGDYEVELDGCGVWVFLGEN